MIIEYLAAALGGPLGQRQRIAQHGPRLFGRGETRRQVAARHRAGHRRPHAAAIGEEAGGAEGVEPGLLVHVHHGW
jgi:hypothetical protein